MFLAWLSVVAITTQVEVWGRPRSALALACPGGPPSVLPTISGVKFSDNFDPQGASLAPAGDPAWIRLEQAAYTGSMRIPAASTRERSTRA